MQNDAISMSNAISRSAALSMMDKYIDMARNDEMHHAMCAVAEGLAELPSLDVAPVVRCKDCRYRFTDNCPMYFEELTYNEDDGYEWIDRDHTSDDGFCNEGARMDGEENAAD